MAAKKKRYDKERTERLEKICKKLETVPLENWQDNEEYFSTHLDRFEFRICGYYGPGANEITLKVYEISTGTCIESYANAPLHSTYEKLIEPEKKGIQEFVKRTFDKWLEQRNKNQAVKK